ncbi:leucine ABC transporter subunit substrate-binding protein LivK [Pandoraea terrae]|uniref:Leucine ABC transporter subunit substrate-binding protein LivK n=1 Tax=Pandoraea terrae TaxID=1537710 RepID=A0A5E4VPP7_9BURK|nr:high-affinity branched-chain amino acid ABC transporter substrate-binding protein [Pandoraea terrae]VVE13244.1 leucine ABC transporter subunit substrate-binding protein LivK [Pandoraea terrae]
MRRFHSLVSLAAAIGIVLTLPLQAHAETLRIAIAGPMSGALAQYGDMVKAGVHTAAERINANGGAGGRPLEIVEMDDACEPKQAVAVANRIVSQGIRYVIGHVCSGAALSAVDIYENEGVIMVTPAATAPQITRAKPRKMIFRTIGRDDQQGPAAAKYIVERVKAKRVAVLHDKQSYGQGIATSVKRALDAAKVPVAMFEGVHAGDTDYSAVITKLKARGIDFVYFGGYHPEMGLLLKQAREQGFSAKFMGPEGVGNKDLTAIAGASSEGMLLTLPADFAADPANADVVQAFRAKGRDLNGPFQMPAFAAVQVIAEAVAASKSTDTAMVAKTLRARAFDTPIGKLEYDARGDLKAFEFVVFEWHKDASKTIAG